MNIGAMEQLLRYLDEKRGRRLALARALNCRPSAISQWDRVPVDRVADVERLTGISRHELRPDVFGPAPEAGPAARSITADPRCEA